MLIRRFLTETDKTIRGLGDPVEQNGNQWKWILVQVFVWGPLYGIAMGSYAWIVGAKSLSEQIPQMLISGIKVPLLIGVTLLISLPGFFVINTLLGLRGEIRSALTAILSTQSGVVVMLAALAPLPLIFYTAMGSTGHSYSWVVMFNAAMFGTASVLAQVILRRRYSPMIRNNPLHRWMLVLWLVLYSFAGIQVGWTLRPFIGSPHAPVTFFRNEPFSNAYVEVTRVLRKATGL